MASAELPDLPDVPDGLAWPIVLGIDPGTLVMGTPAVVKRELLPEAIAEQRCHAQRYAQLAASHAQING